MKAAELAKRLARISAGGGSEWKKDNFLEAAGGGEAFRVCGSGPPRQHGDALPGGCRRRPRRCSTCGKNGHLVEANLEAEDNEGFTPLERGALANQEGSCEMLAGVFQVNYHRFDADGTTIADRATDRGKNAAGDYLKNLAKTQLREKLFNAPPALGLRDVEARTALHYAVLERDWDAAEDLVSRGADWNAVDGAGESPLWYVLRGGDEQGYAFYKRLGFEAIQVNRRSEILLHAVVFSGNAAMIRDVHQRMHAGGREGNFLNIRDNNDLTPLHLTPQLPPEKGLATARLLLELGADAVANTKILPVTSALKVGNVALAEILLDATIKTQTDTTRNHWERSHEWARNFGCAIRYRGERTLGKLLAESEKNLVLGAALNQFARPYIASNIKKAFEHAEASSNPEQEREKVKRIRTLLKKAYPQAFAAPAKTSVPDPGP